MHPMANLIISQRCFYSRFILFISIIKILNKKNNRKKNRMICITKHKYYTIDVSSLLFFVSVFLCVFFVAVIMFFFYDQLNMWCLEMYIIKWEKKKKTRVQKTVVPFNVCLKWAKTKDTSVQCWAMQLKENLKTNFKQEAIYRQWTKILNTKAIKINMNICIGTIDSYW